MAKARANGRQNITRRAFLATAAVLGGTTLTGCSSSTDEDGFDIETGSKKGYASDTEVKNYPVHLKIYAYSPIQYSIQYPTKDKPWDNTMDLCIGWYQREKYRDTVSFEIVYTEYSDLLDMMQNGFPDGDGVIAPDVLISLGCELGTVDGGPSELYVRRISTQFFANGTMVRASGSEVMLPPASTIDGEDLPDGTINRVQQLPNFDGLIAIADPSNWFEGVLTNRMLKREGFYADYDDAIIKNSSGYYDTSIADKLRMYPNQESAMTAVASGKCQLGILISRTLDTVYQGLEECYHPPGGLAIVYHAGALTNAAEPGVVKDFFQYITMLYT